ncbi:MAG: hypothetical protein QM736_02325 [Vicinamibacterales bacterium]
MKAARAVAFLAAVMAASCGAPLMKLPSGPGEPASDGAAALAQATATCQTISTISAEVGVSGSVAGSRVRGRLLTGLASPDSLYMEAPAPFGAPVFVLGASQGDATLVLPRDRRVLEHGRPEDVLAAVTGVPLTPADLKATLTGCIARADDAGEARAVGANWRVLDGDERRYLRRENASSPWRLVSVVRTGTDGWRADYSAFSGDLPADNPSRVQHAAPVRCAPAVVAGRAE